MNRPHKLAGERPHASRAITVCALFVLAAAIGCQPDDINRQYGQRRSAVGADSVNGTATFAKMYEQAGHKVTTWRRLSPKLNQYDTLVWFPDTYRAPTQRERHFLDQWLARGSSRTLIYVGRDYDAGPLYWTKMQANAPAGQESEIATRISDAIADKARKRKELSDGEYARWFVVRSGKPQKVTVLEGPWSQGIDASKTELAIDVRLDPVEAGDLPKQTTTAITPVTPKRSQKAAKKKYLTTDEYYREPPGVPLSETLLSGDGAIPIVRRVTERPANEWYTGGKVIVITNGSFLVNMALVNHEHRKLAAKVIAEGSPLGKVAFLESDQSGLETFSQEPDAEMPSGLELFTIFPINAVILHLVAVGILFCFAVLPIFGRPRQLPRPAVSDFAAHIAAVGELLQFSGDRNAAKRTLDEYNKVVRTAGRKSAGPAPAAPPPATPPPLVPPSGPQ